MQIILRYKLLLVIMIMLFMILTNYNLAIAIKEQLNPASSSNFWVLLIKAVSEQNVAPKENHSDFTVFYRFLRIHLSELSVCSYLGFIPKILSIFKNEFHFRYVRLFFTIYYQLARTSFEKSDPYLLIGDRA